MDIPVKIENFKKKLEAVYPDIAGKITSTFEIKKPKTFRIIDLRNEQKILGDLKSANIEIIASEIPHAYICTTNSEKLSKTQTYLNNQIYIQELSSMLPVIALDIEAKDKVLDMTAAPGSKSIQIAQLLDETGELVAVEKAKDRYFKLKRNLAQYGFDHIKVFNTDARFLDNINTEYIEYFDKVLLDAPCSSEGSLCITEPESFQFWNPKRAKAMSKIQKGLIEKATRYLKKGGTLVYSTCTISIEENEGVVDWFLKRNTAIELETINLDVIDSKQQGILKHNDKEFDSSISKTIRIIPDQYWNAFYLAKFRKL